MTMIFFLLFKLFLTARVYLCIDEVNEDIELGKKEHKTAGLASMETLDDSTKDPWTETEAENGNGTVEAVKKPNDDDDHKKEADQTDADKKAADDEEKEKPIPIWQQIREYNCSIGIFI